MLLGSGGRESTIAWKLRQSAACAALYIAPGNGGTQAYGTNVALDGMDFGAVAEFCAAKNIDMLFVGNEDPLVAGIRDYMQAHLPQLIVIGPGAAGAQLEGSKAFSKKLMQQYGIPTASYREFGKESYEEGLAYLQQHPLPIVLKADGLAAGKGVVIAHSREEALATFEEMIQHAQFGKASERVVIEQFLEGIECSVFVLTDGESYAVLPEAKDYKRIGEGDQGPNTGGMGAISPVPFATPEFMEEVKTKIIAPTLHGLRTEGIPYQGFIFLGLIKVDDAPMVIEYNCRLGDPETEVVLPRLDADLVQLCIAMHEGTLRQDMVQQVQEVAATVMLVSQGYPGSYAKGKDLKIADEATNHSLLLQAGTKMTEEGLQTNGGRVLAVTSLAPTLAAAVAKSYESIEHIHFEGKTFRSDIGYEFL